MAMDLSNYVDVATRLRTALERWPELRIQETGHQVVTIGDATYLAVTMTVWRNPDDTLPTVASAWEPWPGRTPYTRASEYMVAATSALGRALGYMGAAVAGGIATTDEIAARQDAEPAKPAKVAVGGRAQRKQDTPAGDTGATPLQLATLASLLTGLGYIDRSDKLAEVVRLVGRPLEASTQLTHAEAQRVIVTLQEREL
jgi:hypothetical protein